MYSNWHCWRKRQSLIFKVSLNINLKNLTMFIQVVENVEIPLCYKIPSKGTDLLVHSSQTGRESSWS